MPVYVWLGCVSLHPGLHTVLRTSQGHLTPTDQAHEAHSLWLQWQIPTEHPLLNQGQTGYQPLLAAQCECTSSPAGGQKPEPCSFLFLLARQPLLDEGKLPCLVPSRVHASSRWGNQQNQVLSFRM